MQEDVKTVMLSSSFCNFSSFWNFILDCTEWRL